MPYDFKPLQLIELTSFEPSFAVQPGQTDAVLRSYTTLLVEEAPRPRYGASSVLVRVQNTEQRDFALKLLRMDDVAEEDRARVLASRSRQFHEEYRSQLAVSHLKGFPRLYGHGIYEDVPAILMEWVPGFSLREFEAAYLATDALPSGATVAGLGISVLEILSSTQALDENFAHRDLSARNIMVRTDREDAAAQLRDNRFDICLVDLGSATLSHGDTSLTMVANIWRGGTPDYAPPEMLTSDVPAMLERRGSSLIDVYALCSILYELYTSRPPYDFTDHFGESPYRVKMDHDPEPLKPRCPEDEPLVEAIMRGLAREQDARPNVVELRAELERYAATCTDQETTVPEALIARLSQQEADKSSLATYAEASPTADLHEETPLAADLQEETPLAADRTAGTPDDEAPHDRTPSLTRRRVLIGAGAVGALAIGAGVLHGLGILLPGRRSLADYTWANLQAISQELADMDDDAARNEVAQRYGLLDEDGRLYLDRSKTIEVAGEARNVVLWDICHDVRENGAACGLTFSFAEVVGRHQMCADPAYTAGWSGSDLRAWLNSEDGFLAQLPDDVRAVIQPAQKLTNNVGAAQSALDVSPTEDLIWLPAYTELVGARPGTSFSEGFEYLADVLNAEGTQYRYFSQQNAIHRGSEDVFIRNEDGKPAYWWLRTPSPDVTESKGQAYFNQGAPNGDVFHNAVPVNETSGIIPCFCL